MADKLRRSARNKVAAPKEVAPQSSQPLISIEESYRRQLLPYIALGWAPVVTKTTLDQCGLYALARGLTEVGTMISGADQGVTFEELRLYRENADWERIVDNFLEEEQPTLTAEDARKAKNDLLNEEDYYSEDFLQLMVWQVNQERQTAYRLGVVHGGSKTVQPNARILGASKIGPIVWIHNHGTGKRAHWSAFAPPPWSPRIYMKDEMEGWMLDKDAAKLVEKGLYRVIPGNDQPEALVYDGEFLSAIAPPTGHLTPDGSMHMEALNPDMESSEGGDRRVVGDVPISRLFEIKGTVSRGLALSTAKKQKDSGAPKTGEKRPRDTNEDNGDNNDNNNGGGDGDDNGGAGDDATEQPKQKKRKTTNEDQSDKEPLNMYYLNKNLKSKSKEGGGFYGKQDNTNEHTVENSLFLQIAKITENNDLPCRDISNREYNIPLKNLVKVPNPWGIAEMRRLQQGARPPLDTMPMYGAGSLSYLHHRVFGKWTKERRGQDNGKTKDDYKNRLRQYYDDGGRVGLGAPALDDSGLPLKIREVPKGSLKKEPFSRHFRHKYLLELEEDDDGNTLPTASAQRTTAWVALNDLSDHRIDDPWGIRVDQEYPSTLQINDRPAEGEADKPPGQEKNDEEGASKQPKEAIDEPAEDKTDEPSDDKKNEEGEGGKQPKKARGGGKGKKAEEQGSAEDKSKDVDEPETIKVAYPQGVPVSGHCNDNNHLMVLLLDYILTTDSSDGRQAAIDLWPAFQNDHSIIIPPKNVGSREPHVIASELLLILNPIEAKDKNVRRVLAELKPILEVESNKPSET